MIRLPSVSSLSLILTFLLVTSNQAIALDECGAVSPGGTVTCTGSSYSRGVSYRRSGTEGFTLLFRSTGTTLNIRFPYVHGITAIAIGSHDLILNTFDTPLTIKRYTNLNGVRYFGTIHSSQRGLGGVSIATAATISTSGRNSYGIVADITGAANTKSIIINYTGGTMYTHTDSGSGIYADHKGLGGIYITTKRIINNATYNSGYAGIQVVQSNSASAADIMISHGEINTNTNGIKVNSATSGNIVITSNGNIDAGLAASGIYVNNNGIGDIFLNINEAYILGGTEAALNTSTNGVTNIVLNAGADVKSHSGQAIINGAGASNTIVRKGARIAGSIRFNGGNDKLIFADSDFSGVTVLDGGIDSSSNDNSIDTLIFSGSSGALTGTNIRNWENIAIHSGSTISLTDNQLTAKAVTIGNGGTLNAGANFNLRGSLMLETGGVVNLQNGVADDTFTITGNYSGGGTVKLDTELGDSNSKTDMLIIDGDSSGKTLINIRNAGGRGRRTGKGKTDGTRIVKVKGKAQGTFALANQVHAGIYGYSLTSNGYLQSDLQEQIYGYSAIQNSLYEQIATQSQRSNHKQFSLDKDNPGYASYQNPGLLNLDGTRSATGSGLWLYASYSDIISDADIAINDSGPARIRNQRQDTITQFGYEHRLLETGRSSLSGGVFGHYKHFNLELSGVGSSIVTARANGYGGGTSLSWKDNNGFYSDLIGQATAQKIRINGINNDLSTFFNAWTYAASAEIGQRFYLNDTGKLNIIPQMQIIWNGASFDDFTDDYGVTINWQKKNMLTSRIGLTMEGRSAITKNINGSFYATASFLRDFNKADDFMALDKHITSQSNKTRHEIRAGASLINTNNNKNLFTEITFAESSSGRRYKSIRTIIGFKSKL